MTISTNMENQIMNRITDYGNSVYIKKQTASYNTGYDEATPNWVDSTSSSATALILPFSPKTTHGQEYQYYEQGILREDDYIAFFKATETIEESTNGSTATRYVVTFNNLDYEIIKIFPIEFQDNVIVKKCFLRKITT